MLNAHLLFSSLALTWPDHILLFVVGKEKGIRQPLPVKGRMGAHPARKIVEILSDVCPGVSFFSEEHEVDRSWVCSSSRQQVDDMARGIQKVQAQQKNAAKNAGVSE